MTTPLATLTKTTSVAHTSDLSDSTLGSPKINRQVLLMSRPQGIPQRENFEIVQSALPQIGLGLVLVRAASQ